MEKNSGDATPPPPAYISPPSSGKKRPKFIYDNKDQKNEIMGSKGKETKSDKLHEIWLKYMGETSIHGLKYICEKKNKPMEKVFWILAVSMSVIMAITFCYKIIYHWKVSPVLVSFDSIPKSISTIPFPAITICNMNKVQASRVKYIDDAIAADPNDHDHILEREFVDEICEAHAKPGEAAYNSSHDMDLSGDQLHHYLEDLAEPCDEMILRCSFEGHERKCSDLFMAQITDEGLCCSFNTMPEPVMFKNDAVKIKQNETLDKKWQHWDLETGYHSNIYDVEVENKGASSHRRRRATVDSTNEDFLNEELPLRGIAPGKSMGLSVMLNVKEDEYYCSGTESVGFKTLLHMPMTMPELLEYGFGVHPGKETFVSVRPEMIHADSDIHEYDYHKRQCYLDSDRELFFFKNYTFLNCFQECAANYTKEHCGCVAFYMPRNPDTTPICSPEKADCVHEALVIVEETAFDDTKETVTNCQCLPGCSNIEYPHEYSNVKLSRYDLIHIPKDKEDAHPEFKNDSYIHDNMAILHIYFEKLHFVVHERGELYTTIEIISNIGGLLGLCLGFSVLSLVEFIYFFTARLFFNIVTPRSE